MAQAHLEIRLGRIDPGHALPETGAVHLSHLQHPINPGMDHLVAERAEGGLPGQGIQQRPRQHDLADLRLAGAAAPAVEASRAGEPTIAPAQIHQGPSPGRQGAVKVLPVEAMEEGKQRFEGHAAARGSGTAAILASPSVRLWTALKKRHT